MKIGLLSDLHYSSALLTCGKRHNSEGLERLRAAYAHFREAQCDLAIILGDLADSEKEHALEIGHLEQIRDVLNEAPFETLCLMGNHDAFLFSQQDFYEILGKERLPRLISRDGVHLLFLDACYFHTGEHYTPGHVLWTDTFYPHVQALQETLQGLSGDVYVFMHQNIDPNIRADHCLCNAGEVRAVLEESRKVRAVYQGHFHPGHEETFSQIRYITLPALCEQEGAFFVADIP